MKLSVLHEDRRIMFNMAVEHLKQLGYDIRTFDYFGDPSNDPDKKHIYKDKEAKFPLGILTNDPFTGLITGVVQDAVEIPGGIQQVGVNVEEWDLTEPDIIFKIADFFKTYET
jgi:hypothetical protein